MAMSDRAERRRTMMNEYADRVWGQRDGWVAVMFGIGGRFETGRYTFRVISDFARWPRERAVMVGDLLEASEENDIFVCPLLRSSPDRRATSALPGPFLYADVDADVTAASYPSRQKLKDLTALGGFSVGSGSGGHRHVYVRLAKVPELDEFERLNQRLANTLVGGDAKWSGATVLRLPGTWNHKGRAQGESSSPVVMT
jgi:putative DNA primase/helicase